MSRTRHSPGDREAEAPPAPSSDAFHRPTISVGADAFSRATVPGEYPGLAIERAIHDVPDEVADAIAPRATIEPRADEPSIEAAITAPAPRLTAPLVAPVTAPAPLPFVAPTVSPTVDRATRPAIPRALPSSPSFTSTSEELPPASISLSPFASSITRRSSMEAPPVSRAPRRSALLPLLGVGVAIAIAGVVAIAARKAPPSVATAPSSVSAAPSIQAPPRVAVASPVEAAGDTPIVDHAPASGDHAPASGDHAPASGAEPAPRVNRAPRAAAKVEAPKAPRKPAQTPKATNRPFDVED